MKSIIKRVRTLFLKAVVLVIAMVVLLFMVWFPQAEGRAANLDLLHIYTDPLILYCYLASVPFFVALYQALKLLGYVERNKVFSLSAVKAVRSIKYCAIISGSLIMLGIIYIRLFVDSDDPAGATALSVAAIFVSIVIAVCAAVCETILQKKLSPASA